LGTKRLFGKVDYKIPAFIDDKILDFSNANTDFEIGIQKMF